MHRVSCAVVAGLALAGCQATPQPEPAAAVLRPFDGVLVTTIPPSVQIETIACLDAGWLEQIACAPHSREHESLVVVKPRPSEVHAALLLAGFQPGQPGRWKFENDCLEFVPPIGAQLDVFVRYQDTSGRTIEEPIAAWIEDELGQATFPDEPWVFGGSMFAANPEWMDPGEHYVADLTGSIIGLVTFGDEVVGFHQVLPDQDGVQLPQWQVRTDHVPPVGTRVTVILRGVTPGRSSP